MIIAEVPQMQFLLNQENMSLNGFKFYISSIS